MVGMGDKCSRVNEGVCKTRGEMKMISYPMEVRGGWEKKISPSSLYPKIGHEFTTQVLRHVQTRFKINCLFTEADSTHL